MICQGPPACGLFNLWGTRSFCLVWGAPATYPLPLLLLRPLCFVRCFWGHDSLLVHHGDARTEICGEEGLPGTAHTPVLPTGSCLAWLP